MQELKLMAAITDRHQGERLIKVLREEGVPLVMAALGRGTATREMLDYFGLEATEKEVLFAVASGDVVRRAVRNAIHHLMIDVPGNGLLVTAPVSSVGGGCAMGVLCCAEQSGKDEEEMKHHTDHELIVIIHNEGYTDFVMDAARSGGATGGTVIRAKGTGSEQAQRFFGVSLAAEKEMVFIVASSKDKNGIMKAVMTDAGVKSKAQSMVFSIPLDSVIGLRLPEEDLV